jgi:hypothetical protein
MAWKEGNTLKVWIVVDVAVLGSRSRGLKKILLANRSQHAARDTVALDLSRDRPHRSGLVCSC